MMSSCPNQHKENSSDEPVSNRDCGVNSGSRIVLRSEQLLQGRSEIWIDHHGQMYRLRLTGNGKLYLTK